MAIAVSTGEPIHKDLKSCPGGWVELRPMTYGEKLQRRSYIDTMTMEGDKRSKDVKSTIKIFNETAEIYDFRVCVINHNLTDLDERPLSFTNPMDVKKLTGPIAEEIGKYIDELNNFEDDEDLGN